MYLNGGIMVVLGYIIGYMFGQMNIKTELKEQGIIFESKKPSFVSRIMGMIVGQAKGRPKDVPQNINQATPSVTPPVSQSIKQPSLSTPPPVPKNRTNINNFKK